MSQVRRDPGSGALGSLEAPSRPLPRSRIRKGRLDSRVAHAANATTRRRLDVTLFDSSPSVLWLVGFFAVAGCAANESANESFGSTHGASAATKAPETEEQSSRGGRNRGLVESGYVRRW